MKIHAASALLLAALTLSGCGAARLPDDFSETVAVDQTSPILSPGERVDEPPAPESESTFAPETAPFDNPYDAIDYLESLLGSEKSKAIYDSLEPRFDDFRARYSSTDENGEVHYGSIVRMLINYTYFEALEQAVTDAGIETSAPIDPSDWKY